MINLNNVCKSIKGREILHDISLTISAGQVIGIRGANGSGKTMLLRTVAGLVYPSSGTVRINGIDLRKTASFPARTGLLIESPAFLPHYTALENCSLLASLRKIATEKDLEDCLARVGLNPHDERRVGKFSLGMKQRLGLAVAFMEEPEIILLDEPTNALDEEGVQMLSNLVLDAQKRDACVIVASHEAAVLNVIADKIYTMKEGRLLPCAEKAGGDLA